MMSIVRVYHNISTDYAGRPMGMLDGYAPGHRLTMVMAYGTEAAGLTACNEAYRLLNVGDDPEFGVPDDRAVTYRARGNRSLSVGDVLAISRVVDNGESIIGECTWYACASVGWTSIDTPRRVLYRGTRGSTPLFGCRVS